MPAADLADSMGAMAPAGGGGMPPAVAAAGIGAAGSLIGGLIGAHSQGKAMDAQAAANAQAIQLQREAEAEKRREFDIIQAAQQKQWEVRQQQLAPFYAARMAVLSRYGIKPPVMPTQMPSAAPGGAADATALGAAPPPSRGATIGALMGVPAQTQPTPVADASMPGMTIGNLATWNDWSNYGQKPVR